MEAGGREESSKRVGWRGSEGPDPACRFSTLAVHENQLGSLQKNSIRTRAPPSARNV